MYSAAEEAFDKFCRDDKVYDNHIGLVRRGWEAALDWLCSAPSTSHNKRKPKQVSKNGTRTASAVR